MIKTSQLAPSDWVAEAKVKGFNRTGASINAGYVAAANMDFVNASYVTIDDTPGTDARYNMVVITAENQFGLVVVAAETIANGAEGNWYVIGKAIPVNVPNGTTVGDILAVGVAAGTVTAGQLAPYATQALLDAIQLPTAIVGICLEANATGAVAAKKVCFNGEPFRCIYGGGG